MTLVPDIEEAAAPDLDLGIALFLVLAQPARWLHRRVEHVGFVDATNLRRSISLDFSLPGEDLTFSEDLGVIPLALLSKSLLLDVDVTDEAGAALPVLTSSQNAFVAWSILAAVAADDVTATLGEGKSLSPAITDELRSLVLAPPNLAAELLRSVLDPARGDGLQREAMASEDSPFVDIAAELVEHFLLLTELDAQPGRRRIVKFGYVQPLQSRPGRSWERFLGRMGWLPIQFDFETPAVGEGRSYHFEFVPPEGLEVSDGELFVVDGESEGAEPVTIAGARAHAYSSNESPAAEGIVSLWLRPVRVGLLRALLLTSAVIAAVLWTFFAKLDRIEGDVASAILLTMPGIVATFIVRPGEHRLASDLLLGIRAVGGAAALSAYAAAVALVTVTGTPVKTAWLILAVVATLCFASLAVSYLGLAPRPFGEAPEEGTDDD